jgi:hypothetical protein
VVLGFLTTDGLGRGIAQPQVVTLTRLRTAFTRASSSQASSWGQLPLRLVAA